MTSLQKAAQELVDRIADLGASPLDWPEYTALEKALEAEQAQAVEPAAWLVRWRPTKHEPRDINPWVALSIAEYRSNPSREERPLFTHPAPPSGERVPEAAFGNTQRAELIHWLRERSMWDGMIRLIDAANMLESDVSLINEGNEAQQVAVPAGWVKQKAKATADMLEADLPNNCSLSWGGFKLYGDEKSIKEAKRMHHEAGIVPELKQLLCDAQQVAVPMTKDEKTAAWFAATLDLPSGENFYLRGMLDAESHHGIGAKP